MRRGGGLVAQDSRRLLAWTGYPASARPRTVRRVSLCLRLVACIIDDIWRRGHPFGSIDHWQHGGARRQFTVVEEIEVKAELPFGGVVVGAGGDELGGGLGAVVEIHDGGVEGEDDRGTTVTPIFQEAWEVHHAAAIGGGGRAGGIDDPGE